MNFSFGKLIPYITISLIFAGCFLIFSPDFAGPDEPVYYAYTQSLVEDGDLNIINQIIPEDYPYYYPSGTALVSKTYNLPDYHNHGGVVFWAPFYLYGKQIGFYLYKSLIYSGEPLGRENFIKQALSFSTLAFGLFTIILTYIFCKSFFKRFSAVSCLAVALGTPFFYFMLYETANGQILASMLSVLSIWLASFMPRMKRLDWFTYGLFFGICAVVKVDLWFQVFFIAFFLFFLASAKQVNLLNSLYFIPGLLPVLGLKLINDYIKYGTIHTGEFGLLNSRSFYFFEQLFSSYRGFLYTSPILYISLAGLFIVFLSFLKRVIKKDRSDEFLKEAFICGLSFYLLVKVVSLSFRYAWGGGTPGARLLLTEYPVFVLLFAYFLNIFYAKKRFILISFLSLIFILWNIMVIAEFVLRLDITYIAKSTPLIERMHAVLPAIRDFFKLKLLLPKSISLLPLLFMCLWGFILALKYFMPREPLNGKFYSLSFSRQLKFIKFFMLYFYAGYLAVTASNILTNADNAGKLKKSGFFDNARIVEASDFEAIENIGSMDEMADYYRLKGNKGKVKQIERMKSGLYNEYIISQIEPRALD